jgi:C4-dicarboxylate transporter DctQ subunit
METMFAKVDKCISLLSTTLMMVCMSVATIVAFVNVVMRYLFASSLTWAGPLTEYLFIWSALFGAAYGFKIGMHIGVNAIIQNLPARLAKGLLIVNIVVMIGFLSLLTKWGIDFIQFSINLQQIDIDLRIPFWTIYLCVPLSLAIMVYELLVKLYRAVTIPVEEFTYDAVMKESAEDVEPVKEFE